MTFVWSEFFWLWSTTSEADSGHHNVCSPKSLAFIEPLQDILVAGGRQEIIAPFRPIVSTHLGQGRRSQHIGQFATVMAAWTWWYGTYGLNVERFNMFWTNGLKLKCFKNGWLAHVYGAQDMQSQYELNTTRLLFPTRRFCTSGDMSE